MILIHKGDLNMRIYYIFLINNNFTNLYQHNPLRLFKTLERIYSLNKTDLILGYRLFEQIALPFNKNEINEYIYTRYIHNETYNLKANIHTIENHYKHEYSKLVVNNSNLKIKSNINYPDFLTHLNHYSPHIFICDFVNHDYFWLNQVVSTSENLNTCMS